MARPSTVRIRQVRAALACGLSVSEATPAEAASALASALLDVLVAQRADDAAVPAEMRRIAARLVLLADAPVAEVAALARSLADSSTS